MFRSLIIGVLLVSTNFIDVSSFIQHGGGLQRTIVQNHVTFQLHSSSSSTNDNNVAADGDAYDLVIIGGGAAGLTAAKFATRFDKSSIIIEKNKMGGDCTWTGCVPSKSLIASAKVANTVSKSHEYGITVNGGQDAPPKVEFNMKQIKDRIFSNIQEIYDEDDSPETLKKNFNIDHMKGKATIISNTTISVESEDGNLRTIDANYGIIVCTGARPKIPGTTDIPGIDEVDYITYEEIFEKLDVLPKKLTIVGGGPIGCELAQAFQNLGTQVTVVASKLLPREEPEISDLVEQLFEQEGVKQVKGRLTRLEKQNSENDGHVAVVKSTTGEVNVEGDMLLLAIGREPVCKGFGLEEIGVEFDSSSSSNIVLNQYLQSSIPTIYAAGDCTGTRKQFTHYAGYQGAIAARNLLLPFQSVGDLESQKGSPPMIPAATFTMPEVSSIGLTEAEAIDQYGANKIGVSKKYVQAMDRAITDGTNKYGLIKIVYNKSKGNQILGASVMGPNAGEIGRAHV